MPVRPVTDPNLLKQLEAGSQANIVAPNPMFPGQIQGQGLNNQGQAIQNQKNSAELPYVAPKAAADASRSATDARVSAATAPAEITSKNAGAQRDVATATAATNNLAVNGGADNSQAKDASFYNRALKANDLYGQTGIHDDPGTREALKAVLPDAIINQFTSPARQQAEAAQRDFIASTLRYESGAAISNSEFENQRKIYFPTPGDSPEVVAMKAQLRQNAIDGLRLSAGPAAPKIGHADYSGMVGGPQQSLAVTDPNGTAFQQTYRNVEDPGMNAALASFIRHGAPYSDVVAFTKAHGFGPPSEHDYAAGVAFARQHGGAVNTSALKAVPTTLGQRLASSPASSLLAGAATGATAGLSDVAGRAIAGPTWDANRAALSATNPTADLLGNIAGQAGFEGLLGKAAGGVLAKPMIRRGADAAYGATYAASENPDASVGDIALGGGLNTLGGMVGRGLQGAAGRVATGVKNPNLQYLDNRGVPLTLGQIGHGSDNTLGHAIGGIEERMAGLPVADAIINTARKRGDVGFNQEIGRQMAPGVTSTGPEALAQARAAEQAAYAKIAPVSIPTDPTFDAGLTAADAAAKGLRHHAGDVRDVIKDVRAQVTSGQISGKGYQTALQAIRKTRAGLNDDVGGKAKDILDGLESEVMGLGSRVGGPVGADLAAANAIHGRIKTVERALKGAGAQANDELISPKALDRASIMNTEKYGGIAKALSSERPFYDLTTAGKNVMPNLTPDSGTAGRAMLYSALFGGGLGGGAGFLQSDKGEGGAGATEGALKGLTLAGLLAAPYSKAGQKVIQKALLGDRPKNIVSLGDFLINNRLPGSVIGQAVARKANQ